MNKRKIEQRPVSSTQRSVDQWWDENPPGKRGKYPIHSNTEPKEAGDGAAVLRLLVVGSHALARQSLCRLLEIASNGKISTQATNEEDAIQVAEHFHPNLAVVDMALPSKREMEVVRTLRRHYPTLRIVALLPEEEKLYRKELEATGVKSLVRKQRFWQELPSTLSAIWEYESGQHEQEAFEIAESLTRLKNAPTSNFIGT